MASKPKPKSKKEEVIAISTKDKVVGFIKEIYNDLISILGVVLDNIDFLISKLFKVLLYCLEGIGAYYVFYMLTKYNIGLELIKAGQVDIGNSYINALVTSASALNGIVAGMAVGLPVFLGAMKIAHRKLLK